MEKTYRNRENGVAWKHITHLSSDVQCVAIVLVLHSDLLLTEFACMQHKKDVRYNRKILSTDTCSKTLPHYL